MALGVETTFHTPYMNVLTLRGTKKALNLTRPAEFTVTPTNTGPFQVDPTGSWVVALGSAPDYGFAATASGPPTEPSQHGCLPRERTAGMAILTRERVAPPDVIRQAKASMALLVRAPCASLPRA